MIEQIAIAVTGLVAIWLTQSSSSNARKYACIFGLIGQPFWLYSSLVADQYGIFVLSIFYTIAWAKGVKTNWINKGM